jgi:hypothetical protein
LCIAAHRFVVNLRTETLSDVFRAVLAPRSYLVPGNASGPARDRAGELATEGFDVFADNGFFDDVGRIAQTFAAEADRLHLLVEERERLLDRSLRPGDLELRVRDAYRELAAEARAQSLRATADRETTLTRQRSFGPTRVIGAEDITMAVWLSLNIEPPYVQLPRRNYRRMNEAVARTAAREIERMPRSLAAGYYTVVSALDYDGAFDAGRACAKEGLTRVAMGFGAYMADDHFTDHAFIGRRRIDFGTRMPNRYLRTALVARGFWNGYRATADAAPVAFHFLGLGAPIMIGLVALAGSGTKLLTYDATSPIRDAVEGTLYLTAPAPLKVRTRRLAKQLASGTRGEWNCPCPFCGPFAAKHPFDYDAGHAWHARHPGEEPSVDDLRPGGPLFDAFPLFSEPASGELRAAVSFARMGHNHWAIGRIMSGLNASSSTRARIAAHVEGLVERYQAATNSPRFAAAVRFALELATGDIA